MTDKLLQIADKYNQKAEALARKQKKEEEPSIVSTGLDMLQTALNEGANDLTLGAYGVYERNARAAMDYGAQELGFGDDEPKSYSDFVELHRQGQKARQRRNPISSATGSAVGAAVGMGKAKAASSLLDDAVTTLSGKTRDGLWGALQRILFATGAGAGANVATEIGAGQVEDLEDAGQAALWGGVLPGGLQGIKETVSPFTKMALRVFGNTVSEPDAQRAAAKAFTTAEAGDKGSVPLAANRGAAQGQPAQPYTPQELQNQVESMHPGQALVDAVPELAPAQRKYMGSPENYGRSGPIVDMMQGRVESGAMEERLYQAATKDLPVLDNKVATYADFNAQLSEARDAYGQIFGTAYAKTPIPRELSRHSLIGMVTNAFGKGDTSAMRKLRQDLVDEILDAPGTRPRRKRGETTTAHRRKGELSPKTVHALKLRIDDIIAGRTDTNVGTEQKIALIRLKDSLNGRLRRVLSETRNADAGTGFRTEQLKFAQAAESRELLDMGAADLKTNTMDASQVKEIYDAITDPVQKVLYKQGQLLALHDMILANPNAFSKKVLRGDAKPPVIRKLEAIHGEGFMDDMIDDIRKIQTETSTAKKIVSDAESIASRTDHADSTNTSLAQIMNKISLTSGLATPGGLKGGPRTAQPFRHLARNSFNPGDSLVHDYLSATSKSEAQRSLNAIMEGHALNMQGHSMTPAMLGYLLSGQAELLNDD